MSPPAWRGMRKGSAATIARGSRTGQRRKAPARTARGEAERRRGRRSGRRGPAGRRSGGSATGRRGSAPGRGPARPASPPSAARPAGSRIAAAAAPAATRTPAPARKSLNAASVSACRSPAAGGAWRGAVGSPRRDEDAVLAEQLDPQLVAARRRGAAAALAPVPVEGEEVVALQIAPAGEGDDQPAPRLDDLDRRVVGLGDAEADPHAVEAAVAVRGEGAAGRVAERHPVEDQRVALEPLGPGEGGDGCEDEQREDDARRRLPADEALSSPITTATGAPAEPGRFLRSSAARA